jgi:hypothetical protein
MNEQNWLAEQFEENRSHLRGVASRASCSGSAGAFLAALRSGDSSSQQFGHG